MVPRTAPRFMGLTAISDSHFTLRISASNFIINSKPALICGQHQYIPGSNAFSQARAVPIQTTGTFASTGTA